MEVPLVLVYSGSNFCPKNEIICCFWVQIGCKLNIKIVQEGENRYVADIFNTVVSEVVCLHL